MATPIPRLDTSNNPPLKSLEGIKQLLQIGQLVPGLNVPTSIILIAISIGQGDVESAGGNGFGLIPGFKLFRGISKFKPGVGQFAERLYDSKLFGKDSFLFGNKLLGNSSQEGLLNRGGSVFKVGWSGTPQEMSFINPRYLNGIGLNPKLPKRSSFTGGGKQFRITVGRGNGQQGLKHLYVPRTFVPDSIGNR